MKAEADGLKKRAAEEHLGVDNFLMEKLIGRGFVPCHKQSANRHAYRFLKSELEIPSAADGPSHSAIAKEAASHTDIRRASPLSRCKIIDIVGLILDGSASDPKGLSKNPVKSHDFKKPMDDLVVSPHSKPHVGREFLPVHIPHSIEGGTTMFSPESIRSGWTALLVPPFLV
jgi:hypothetical protein